MPREVESKERATLPAVWIVDDSPLEAELVRRSLAPIYRVEVFTDGAAVIEQFASARSPDAVILDWQMPGITGIDVCRYLRSRPQTQSIPILMLTVQHNTHDLVQCLAAGADDFLSKPYHAAELSARIAALVRSKRMHERLQSAERAVRSLLMQLPEGVMSIDREGRLVFVNLEAQRMLGADTASLLGKPIAHVLPALSFERPLATDTEPVMLPDLVLGHRAFAPAIRRYAGVDAAEMTLSFREVTAERRHERERMALLAAEREARAEAENASRAKDDFLAVVSHELRTPLNAILGWARMLRDGTLDHEKRARALETIERNATAQGKLIEDILDVSRIVSGKMQIGSSPIDLGSTIRTSFEAIRLAADAKGIKVTIATGSEKTIVIGDGERVQQIVWNLLSNAVKFTPHGGSVFVEVGEEDTSAFIRVRDTGKGISAGFLPYVFDRFRQADVGTTRIHGGLGLGLSIVRHLAEMHGGSVVAHSDGPALGSTFTVRLPLASEQPGQTGERANAPGAPLSASSAGGESLSGLRILVVDDDEDTRELLVAMFVQRDAEALAVSSVSEALRSVHTLSPSVIVSDLGLPADDGYALIQRLRDLPFGAGGGIPAIALTAFAAPQDRVKALAAGFDAYLAKPVNSLELVRVVVELASPRSTARTLSRVRQDKPG